MAIGPQLRWIKSGLDGKIYLTFLLIISFVISFLILKKFWKGPFVKYYFGWKCFFICFLITIRDFLNKKLKNISQNLSHFGFSLLILSILFNNIFSNEIITNLKSR